MWNRLLFYKIVSRLVKNCEGCLPGGCWCCGIVGITGVAATPLACSLALSVLFLLSGGGGARLTTACRSAGKSYSCKNILIVKYIWHIKHIQICKLPNLVAINQQKGSCLIFNSNFEWNFHNKHFEIRATPLAILHIHRLKWGKFV